MPTNNNKEFWNPNALKSLCDATRISKEVLADKIGISRTSLHSYVLGKTSPGIEALIKIADYFAVPVDVVLGHASGDLVDNVLNDYSKYFMQLRKASYDAYMFSHSIDTPCNALHETFLSKNVEAPWPYNLIDAIFTQPTEFVLTDDRMAGIEKALSFLTDREQEILRKRFIEGKTLNEVGTSIGITRERTRQCEAKALRKLRHPYLLQYIKYGKNGKEEIDELKEREEEVVKRENELLLKENKLRDSLESLNKMMHMYDPVAVNDIIEKTEEFNPNDSGILSMVKRMKLNELELTSRSYNCLRRARVETLEDLVEFAKSGNLSHVRNLGKRSILEILSLLYYFGFDFYDVYGYRK